MRTLLFSAGLLLTGGLAAQAADLPVKAARTPLSAPALSWTGFYVGGQFGYGWAGIRPNGADVAALFGPGLTYSDPQSARGILGGLTVGYNYQFGAWVAGVEGDFSWSDVRGDFDAVALPGPVNVHVDARMNWLATARVRLGYAFGPALLYATGGAAFARIAGNNTNVAPGGTFTSSDANTHSGWTAGAGVEYAITPQLSAKLEALYVGLSEETYQAVRFKGEVAVARIGLNWRF
jgi:outer membrane immunogenic protein